MKVEEIDVIGLIHQGETRLWNELIESQKNSILTSQAFNSGYYNALKDMRVYLLKRLTHADTHE